MKKKYLIKEFLFSLLVILSVVIVQLYYFDMVNRVFSFVFILSMVMVFLFWIFRTRYFYKFWEQVTKEELIKETDRLQLEESKKLIQTLQAQRHDFRNQLQVIRVLAQYDKNEEIVKYIRDCSANLNESNTIVNQIENPVISATLLVVAAEAREKGIHFEVDSDVNFFQFAPSPAQLSRILANILRNAIEALENVITPDRSIRVTIWESPENYTFLIWNNGPIIPEQQLQSIFKPGFSTKNSTGLGLVIVKELLNEVKGSITVNSVEGIGTEFKISVPKSVKECFGEYPVPIQPLPTGAAQDSSFTGNG